PVASFARAVVMPAADSTRAATVVLARMCMGLLGALRGTIPLRAPLHERQVTVAWQPGDARMTVARSTTVIESSCGRPILCRDRGRRPVRDAAGPRLHGGSAPAPTLPCQEPRMRHTILATAPATVLGTTSLAAAAQTPQEREGAGLKARIAALAAQLEE